MIQSELTRINERMYSGMQPKANYLAVFLGGCLGGVSRYGIGLVASGIAGVTIANLIGSFVLSFLTYGLAARFALPNWLILFLGTGFVGAFTTFSTLATATVTLSSVAPASAIVWAGLNLLGGLALAFLGMWLGQNWTARTQA